MFCESWCTSGIISIIVLSATVIDVVTEKVRKGLFHEILYADHWILMSDSTEGIPRKFVNCKDSLESKSFKTNYRKTKLMVGGSKSELLTSKINPCAVCGQTILCWA